MLLVILSIIIWAFGYYYPTLAFDENTDQTQQIAIRILSSYTYYGNKTHFYLLIFVISGLLLVLIPVSYRKITLQAVKRVIKHLALILILCYFFNWQFLKKYSTNLWESISSTYILTFIYLCLDFVGLWLINGIVKKYLGNSHRGGKTAGQTPPRILFVCPHCEKEYHAKVVFCLNCNKKIRL